ncbi:MAG TPA: hypothetical protein PLR06_12335 [Cyclobacteriaceae bacterium]|nr:hypothetical protein [Cyclobacteriaceae bacterium]
MKPDLEEQIHAWKKIQSSHKEVRSVTSDSGNSGNEEFELILKMSVRVVEMAQSETVSVTRKMKTTGQSTAEGNDAGLFIETAKKLEKDFAEKCGKTYERLSRLSNRGDVERNPYS